MSTLKTIFQLSWIKSSFHELKAKKKYIFTWWIKKIVELFSKWLNFTKLIFWMLTFAKTVNICCILTHVASPDCLAQQAHNIMSFTVRGVKAFGPGHQFTLKQATWGMFLLFSTRWTDYYLISHSTHTVSMAVCSQGKEKVKPVGRRAFFTPM